jgi:hypothetical protein
MHLRLPTVRFAFIADALLRYFRAYYHYKSADWAQGDRKL